MAAGGLQSSQMGHREQYAAVFGANLVVLRRLGGYLSQQQLADKLGLSKMTVGRWERGQQLPDAYEIARLCELLGATPSELLEPRELTAVERALLRRGEATMARLPGRQGG